MTKKDVLLCVDELQQKLKCRYCNRKPEFDKSGSFYEWDNEEEIAQGPWTLMYAGVDEKGRMILTASGDGRAVYYPKYCPECGRKLNRK